MKQTPDARRFCSCLFISFISFSFWMMSHPGITWTCTWYHPEWRMSICFGSVHWLENVTVLYWNNWWLEMCIYHSLTNKMHYWQFTVLVWKSHLYSIFMFCCLHSVNTHKCETKRLIWNIQTQCVHKQEYKTQHRTTNWSDSPFYAL